LVKSWLGVGGENIRPFWEVFAGVQVFCWRG
jgi:hypothetical protein